MAKGFLRNHQPLPTPGKWTDDERRFAMRLEDTLTDIYQKLKKSGESGGGGSEISLLDVYPVGSIYMSINTTSPAVLFGGTWARIEGQFLLAATGDTPESGTNIQKTAAVGPGGQGGEAAHQLSENEMPSHRHAINRSQVAASGTERNIVQGNSGTDTYTGYVGGDQTHNNMPPFLAVYVWKRTA